MVGVIYKTMTSDERPEPYFEFEATYKRGCELANFPDVGCFVKVVLIGKIILQRDQLYE